MLAGRPLDKPDPTSRGTPPQSGAEGGRPVELEDWLNRNCYHPLSLRLARVLERTPVTPNMVSIAGGILVVIAGLVYVAFDSAAGAACALLIHMGWHVLDGADGDLARLTGRASAHGEMVDGLCDYLSHLALYLMLAWVLAQQIGPLGWVLVVASGLVRIPQTVFYETQRRQYQWWVHSKEWLRISSGSPHSGGGPFGAIAKGYLRLSALLETGGRRLDLELATLPEDKRVPWRVEIAADFRPVLAPLSLLSSNYRTLAIGVAMLLGSPLYIVAFELVGLSLLLLVLMRRTRRTIAQLADRIAR